MTKPDVNVLTDHKGKPSAMRAAQLICVITGCACIGAYYAGISAPADPSTALWLVAAGFGGKLGQKVYEGG